MFSLKFYYIPSETIDVDSGTYAAPGQRWIRKFNKRIKITMTKKEVRYLDPLYVIFEKYLYDFPHEDLDLFIATIVNEYMDYLKTHSVSVPDKSMNFLMKDLTEEVYDMFIKKVHGCLNLKDFRNSGRITKLEKLLAQDRYEKLAA